MNPSTQELLQEIQDVAVELGRTPMPDELSTHGAYDSGVYQKEFGSWYGAISEAGLEKPPRRRIPENELLAELNRLGSKLDKVPSEQDMTNVGGYGTSTY